MDDTLVYDMLSWIPKIILLSIVIATIMTLVSLVNTQDTTSENLEMQLLVENIYNSNILTYQNNLTKRYYLGTIDENKFNSLNLSKELSSKSKAYILKLELLSKNESIISTKYYLSGKDDTKEEYEKKSVLKSYSERMNNLDPIKKEIYIYKNGLFKKGYIKFYVSKEI